MPAVFCGLFLIKSGWVKSGILSRNGVRHTGGGCGRVNIECLMPGSAQTPGGDYAIRAISQARITPEAHRNAISP